VAYAITNDPGPANPEEYNRVQRKDGIVLCTLYRTPLFGAALKSDLHEKPFSPIFHGRKAHFWLKNLECRLHADDKRGDRQANRIARAMKRLTGR
jgi:hypothetical protein